MLVGRASLPSFGSLLAQWIDFGEMLQLSNMVAVRGIGICQNCFWLYAECDDLSEFTVFRLERENSESLGP